MSLGLGNIPLLLHRVLCRTRLVISQQEISHGNEPLLLDYHRTLLLAAALRWSTGCSKLILLVDPLWVVTEGYLEDGARDLYFDLILALPQLVHLHALLHVAVEANGERLFQLLGLVLRPRLYVLYEEEKHQFLDDSWSIHKLNGLDDDTNVHVDTVVFLHCRLIQLL